MTADLPPSYVYGVAHVEKGEVVDIRDWPTRVEAERELALCAQWDSTDCYLVRKPVPGWEPVPVEPSVEVPS